MTAKIPVLGLCLLVMSVHSALAQAGPQAPVKTDSSSAKQEGIAIVRAAVDGT